MKRDLVRMNGLLFRGEDIYIVEVYHQRRANAVAPNVSERDELLGDLESQSDLDASTMDQRQRLLSGTERLGESSRRLEDSHRLALQTESIGINILSTLKGQRETMLRARDTVMIFSVYRVHLKNNPCMLMLDVLVG